MESEEQTPGQNVNHGDLEQKPDMNTAANGDGKKPAHRLALADELNAMKKRIAELESQSKDAQMKIPPDEESDPTLLAEVAQYRRMERCLYKHRKEWETKNQNPAWSVGVRKIERVPNGDFQLLKEPYYPSDIRYKRPDLFNQPGEFINIDDSLAFPDDFDHEIDYGGRRQRLRKCFEWDMDRLWLLEETEKRRQAKRAQAQEMQKQDLAKDGEEKKREGKSCENPPPASIVEFSVNYLDWYSFKASTKSLRDGGCTIDILVGEPIIDSTVGHHLWYGSPRIRKREKVQPSRSQQSTEPGQSPLPERIHIYSTTLVKILAEILGSDANDLAGMSLSPVTFIRPFKTLYYSEKALRDWHAELERRVKKRESGAEVVIPINVEKSNADLQIDSEFAARNELTMSEEDKKNSQLCPGGDVGQRQADRVAGYEMEGTLPTVGKVEQTEQATNGAKKGDDEESDGGEDETDTDDSLKSPTALAHLKLLLEFIDQEIAARQVFLESPQCRKVHFSDLWYLFRPGTEVIGNDGKQAYRVIHVSSERHRVASPWERWYRPRDEKDDKKHKMPFSITCVYIDFDGKHLGPVSKVFEFKRYDGEREVSSLEVYPLRFHPLKRSDFSDTEWQQLQTLPMHERYRSKLKQRGELFLDVISVKHMYYAGPTLDVRDDIESQVVVDFETAFSVENKEQQKWKPDLELLLGDPASQGDNGVEDRCRGSCCEGEQVHDDMFVDDKQRTEYINSLLPKQDAMGEQPSPILLPRLLKEMQMGQGPIATPDELVIMSYRVFGFVLRNRKWAKLDLTYLSDVHTVKEQVSAAAVKDDDYTTPRTTFDRLIIDEGHRGMILSLIAQHFRDKKSATDQREQVDIVKGKGKGLILLLHGAPGVGKTSTAEGVAELFKKPLFQITCGDLGTTASEVEKSLETNFALANRWDCILLLDEADVFLAERTKEDFKRNGLVAVFLRVMEYYAGVLFLTTNRVGDFDEAFTSRIHISLYYPELSEVNTRKVFELNLEMIEERFRARGRRIEIEKMHIGSFATSYYRDHPQARWNGRQVRNACQTALALAEFEAQGNDHETVLKPDAVVKLRVEHFNVVRNAYLEFTTYITELHGANAARRAKDARLRAIWVDENDRVVAEGLDGLNMSKRRAFRAASQGQQQATYGQQGHPQMGYQHLSPHGAQQPQQQFYEYRNSNIVSPLPSYPDPNPVPMQQLRGYHTSQLWNNATTSGTHVSVPHQDVVEGQNQAVQQAPIPTTPTPQVQVQQPNQAWLAQNIQALHGAGGPQGQGAVPIPGSNAGSAMFLEGSASGYSQWSRGQSPANQ